MAGVHQNQRGHPSRSPGRDGDRGYNNNQGIQGFVEHGAQPSFDQSETFTYGDESTIVTNDGDRSNLSDNNHFFNVANDANVTLPYDANLEPCDEMMLMKNVDSGRDGAFQPHGAHRTQDATQRVKDVHYALLYLMSNPEEFKEVVERRPYGSSSIAEWQEEASHDDDDDDENDNRTHSSASQSDIADDKTETSGNQSLRSGAKSRFTKRENNKGATKKTAIRSDATMNYIARTISHDMEGRSVTGADSYNTPLPYLIFASDAEVVLPQAHTASQLFGIEQVDGMELEAAAGIVPLCQLFSRWLGSSIVICLCCMQGQRSRSQRSICFFSSLTLSLYFPHSSHAKWRSQQHY
jgi:hypothetical protein